MAAVSDASEPVDPRDITLTVLFLGFLQVALSGFGGVLAFARRRIVEERRWVSDRDFTTMLGLCQFLPGPNIVNVSIYIGARFRGPLGSIAAFAGLLLAPMAIVLALGALYTGFGHNGVVRGAFAGVSACAAGLVIGTAIKMIAPLRAQPIALVFGAAAFAAVGLLRWPLIEVLLVLAPVSVAVAWMRRP